HTRFSRDWSSDVCSSDLPGVNILIKSTSRGTVTDLDGRFSIEVPNGQTLVFSSIGFQNQEITIGPNTSTPLNVVLEESATDLGRSEERRVGKESGCRWRA